MIYGLTESQASDKRILDKISDIEKQHASERNRNQNRYYQGAAGNRKEDFSSVLKHMQTKEGKQAYSKALPASDTDRTRSDYVRASIKDEDLYKNNKYYQSLSDDDKENFKQGFNHLGSNSKSTLKDIVYDAKNRHIRNHPKQYPKELNEFSIFESIEFV